MKKKSIFITLLALFFALQVSYIGGSPQVQAATKPTTVQEIEKMLKGWTLAAVNSETYKSRTSISFEKVEPIGKKWAANQLGISMWIEKDASFENDVKSFIQQAKQSEVPLKIKKNTSTVFEASNFDGVEYVYDYIVKTKTGYIVYELGLGKVNEGWRHGVFDKEIPTKARVSEIEKLAPQLIQKFTKYKFVDTQKNEPVMKAIDQQKQWKLTETRITGNVKTEYAPNGWTREFEKEGKSGKYSLDIYKTRITKERHTGLLKRFKDISTLTNSSKYVKAYRTEQPISVIDDYPGGRLGDSRIVFVQKKGSSSVEYYKIYVGAPTDSNIERWNSTDKKEAANAINTVINSLIKANTK
ncbi:hypothetical protein [Peribacillus glennii]|uniref:hypothetical protein n=1 Tax=Peribacillus glennii TaxID=2303991 RepID=UPI00115DBEE1|nr:hypothetical protein [Peribacillus glennii]